MSDRQPTEKELAFLRVVAEHGPARAGYLGAVAWQGGRMPQHYSRPAMAVLTRLLAKKLVMSGCDQWGTNWTVSHRGRKLLDEVGST